MSTKTLFESVNGKFTNEGAKEGGKDAYNKFLKSKLKKHGYDGIGSIPADKKDDFFAEVDKGWKSDGEGSNEGYSCPKTGDWIEEAFGGAGEISDKNALLKFVKDLCTSKDKVDAKKAVKEFGKFFTGESVVESVDTIVEAVGGAGEISDKNALLKFVKDLASSKGKVDAKKAVSDFAKFFTGEGFEMLGNAAAVDGAEGEELKNEGKDCDKGDDKIDEGKKGKKKGKKAKKEGEEEEIDTDKNGEEITNESKTSLFSFVTESFES